MLAAILDEDTDKGPADGRKGRSRLCLATGEVTAIDDMIRYVVAPGGAIVPDIARKLPGRGAWISARRSALEHAIERKLFARAFHGQGKVEPGLPALVEDLLRKATLDSLSLSNKAGQVVTGFEKVREALAGKRILALLHASDASEDGRSKLNAIAKACNPEVPEEIRLFSGEQLDLALGRSNVVHAALLEHPLCRVFLANCLKYERWREQALLADRGIH